MATKYIKRAALAALAFACLPAAVSHGQSGRDPSAGESAISSWQPEAEIPKPCVLLRNDNVLFGQAHQIGQFVVIRDGNSGEFQLPRQEVACWADSIRDLYRYRVDHRTRADVAAHLRDARWCVRYDLYDLATIELNAIRAIDPQNTQANMLESRIARTLAPQPSTVSVVQGADPIQQAAHQVDATDLGDVDLATLRFFAANVQPTLINRCSNCHAHDSGRPWSIIALGTSTRPSSRMTQENLSSALGYIDRRSPQNSELLDKAVSPHGGSASPLDPRHAKSIDALKYWLSMLGRGDFSSKDSNPSSSRQAKTAYVAERPAQEVTAQEWPVPLEETESFGEGDSSHSPVQIVDTPTGPARLPKVRDPFSPDLFNRRHEN